MFFDKSRFLVIISLISFSTSSLNWLFLTSISIMLGLLFRESFNVLALESPMKLQDMSSLLIVLLSFKNSDKDSQNICPKLFEESEKLSSYELLLSRSVQSLAPPLSSIRFSLRFRCLRLLLTFKAYAMYRLPS